MTNELPLLYGHLASWFHLLTAPADYTEEAEIYRRLVVETADRPVATVLELGSGGGNNASHLKAHFRMTLTDRSPDMLALSRSINPECEHLQGDMRSLRLGGLFDAVFVHDAVSYLITADELRSAMATAFEHLAPGGVALFHPDHLRGSFRSSTGHGGHDGDDGRALRYVEWTWDPDPTDSTCIADLAYLLREADGRVRSVHDRHVLGLFSRSDWLRWLTDAGFDAHTVPFEHSEVAPGTSEVFVATRPV